MKNIESYAGVIIKPDSINEGISENIYNDILKAGFKIKFDKIMQIKSEQVSYVYPDKINTSRYPYSHYSVTHGKSRLLVLEKKDIYKYLNEFKGSSYSKGGIREKYRVNTKESLEKKGLIGPALEYELCKNKIHSCDNIDETLLLLEGLLTLKEVEELKTFSYILYKNILDRLTQKH